MYNWIGQHWPLMIGAYFAFSALVSGMPDPSQAPQWGIGYQWFYTSMHALSGDIKGAIASKLPGAALSENNTNKEK